MSGIVHDVRVLKLAEMYEMAYERFVAEVADRVVTDPEVRTRLRRLVSPSEDHGRRIVDALLRLNAKLDERSRPEVERAAVLDVVEIERAARDFYRSNVAGLHDGDARELFRRLAEDESRHVRVAEEALAMLDEHRRPTWDTREAAAVPPRATDALPLHEGVTDFERKPARRRAR